MMELRICEKSSKDGFASSSSYDHLLMFYCNIFHLHPPIFKRKGNVKDEEEENISVMKLRFYKKSSKDGVAKNLLCEVWQVVHYHGLWKPKAQYRARKVTLGSKLS